MEMDDKNLFSRSHEYMKLKKLYHKKQLEDELKTRMELLNSMKESFTVLKEIASLPNTFCDIVEQKDAEFLEIDRKSGQCLRDIKNNVLETFTDKIGDSNEIQFPEDLERGVEQFNLEIQEQQEKYKTWNCLLDNYILISDDIKSDETINIDDISCIKTDSAEIQSRDLIANETMKDMY